MLLAEENHGMLQKNIQQHLEPNSDQNTNNM